ncbi:FolC bifunctional protein [Gigaspora margarita]|uniref:FolC bifunctional protein n=1 Tax=Gigaspora margarita TaxID=4874 RepID=A0A8H4AI01_GIGMA|nr:FolC bifunctional protein [Gigaspora margarita]
MKTGCKVVITTQIEQVVENLLKKYFDVIGCLHVYFIKPLLNLLHGNRKWSVSTKGDFQLENAATTVLASDLLRKRDLKFSIIANYHGKAYAQRPGRLQWVDVLKSNQTT